MSKVQKKIKELEEVLEEVTGRKPEIKINFHRKSGDKNIDFKEAKKMANNLTLDNPKYKRHYLNKASGQTGDFYYIQIVERSIYEDYITIFSD